MSEQKGRGSALAVVAVGAVAVLALVLGSVALAVGHDEEAPSAAPAANEKGMVTSGTGTATGVPDQLSFTVRVSLTRTSVADAMSDASSAMRKVFGAIGKQGVGKKDMQTTGVSVSPSYDYSGSTRRLVGYRATQSARIDVNDLGKASKVLSAAASAGGNRVRIGGVSLGIADRDALIAKARKAAVADAKKKAQEYAAAAGQDLGSMVSLKEVSTVTPEPVQMNGLDKQVRSSAAVGAPIKAGSKDVKVQIRVVWELP